MANQKEIKVPDIGGASSVDVIEILVKEGDTIEKETPLITLESDKASMEIPASDAGVVKALKVRIGDKVQEGDVILIVEAAGAATATKNQTEPPHQPGEAKRSEGSPAKQEMSRSARHDGEARQPERSEGSSAKQEIPRPAHHDEEARHLAAGPAVRRLARELGVDLTQVTGSGRKNRVTKEDVQQFVKNKLQSGTSVGFASEGPKVDFSKFGEIEVKPLNKIKRLTGENVHRSWVTIPHVTQFDEADITDLEAYRKAHVEKHKQADYKLTILAFVCKIISKALEVYPQFNTSINPAEGTLIYKKYYHIGVAVETPNGLVVPVIQNVNRLSVIEIAKELARLSQKARDKGLMPNEMSGGSFTISSLGGIGGTAFTPIVNAPEVAILGLSRSSIKPIFDGEHFKPRLMLPLSLSYDHRVIDGAEAARFTRYVSECLADIRNILL